MDDCPANYKSVSEKVGGFCDSSNETTDCAFGNIEGLSLNDLGHHFTDYLNIQDGEMSNEKCNSETLMEDISKDYHRSDSANGKFASAKCLIKCATFPCSGVSTPPAEFRGVERGDDMTTEVMTHGADVKSPNLPCSRSKSLPAPLKLVSAIKGSREKQGKVPRKLTVTWAPDVYDPIPTSVSHVPNNGQHKSGKKKNGKNKQKNNGKSSRGSKGKDKKQTRKRGGSSEISYHSLGDSNNTDSPSEVQSSIGDFDIGSPDPFCGSSFLKKSITKLHFPVAEAS